VVDGNIEYLANQFVSMMKDRSQSYRTNQLLVPWGDDFKFQNAAFQFQNMDLLMSKKTFSNLKIVLKKTFFLQNISTTVPIMESFSNTVLYLTISLRCEIM
jgi:hypothetical protein